MRYEHATKVFDAQGWESIPYGDGRRYKATDVGCHQSSGRTPPSVTVKPLDGGERVAFGCFGCESGAKVWQAVRHLFEAGVEEPAQLAKAPLPACMKCGNPHLGIGVAYCRPCREWMRSQAK